VAEKKSCAQKICISQMPNEAMPRNHSIELILSVSKSDFIKKKLIEDDSYLTILTLKVGYR